MDCNHQPGLNRSVMAATRTGGVNMVYQTGGLHSGSPSFSLWKNKTHTKHPLVSRLGNEKSLREYPRYWNYILFMDSAHMCKIYIMIQKPNHSAFQSRPLTTWIQAAHWRWRDPSHWIRTTWAERLVGQGESSAHFAALTCSQMAARLALLLMHFRPAPFIKRDGVCGQIWRGKASSIIQQFRARLAASGVLRRTVSKVNDGAPVVEPLHPTEWCCAGSFPNTTILPIRGRAWKYDWDDWPTIRY